VPTIEIRKSLGSFRDIDIWRAPEMKPYELAPLAPVLNLIVHGTLEACDDFAEILGRLCLSEIKHVHTDDGVR
jgi:hypothetical protein